MVADDSRKLRLVIDPLLPNLMFRYEKLQYESLQDLADLAQEGDFGTCTDEKSGFHHCALHPDMWQYLGFQWAGRTYVFTHLPFGVGPAPWTYTVLKQSLMLVLRKVGKIRAVSYIDDQFAAAQNLLLGQFQQYVMLRLQWALGFTMSTKKCVINPVQRLPFLGFEVDLASRKFWLPQAKVENFQTSVGELLQVAVDQQGMVPARMIAKLAGKLISFSVAFQRGKLFARPAHECLAHMEDGWDGKVQVSDELIEALIVVAENLPAWNGAAWFADRPALVVAGDWSSLYGFGIFTPNGELKEPIVVTHTEEEQLDVLLGRMSSVEGELKAVLLALQTLLRARPELLQGKRLHYQSDAKGAVAALNNMSGNECNHKIVRDIWNLAAEHDVQLTLTWHPRETANQAQADAWSKYTDSSQVMLQQDVFDQYIARNSEVTEAGGLAVDVFADNLTCRMRPFWAEHWSPGVDRVDAWAQDWSEYQAQAAGKLLYINPPWNQLGRVLQRLMADRVDAVVVYPSWNRPWQALWSLIKPVQIITLPARQGLLVAGPRSEQPGPVKCHYRVHAAVIRWQKSQAVG